MLSTSQKYILSGPLQKKFANIYYPHALINMLKIIHLCRNSFLFYKYQIIQYTCVLVLFTQYSYLISAWYSIMWHAIIYPTILTFNFILPWIPSPPPFFFPTIKSEIASSLGARFLYLILHQLAKSFNSLVLIFKRKIIIVLIPMSLHEK